MGDGRTRRVRPASCCTDQSISGVTQRVTVITTLALVRLRRGEEGADEMLDEALRLALPTGETSRIARVAAARAEQAWYRGDLPDVVLEAATGLEHVSAHTTPWLNGELLFWQSRAGRPEIAGEAAQPYRLMLAGDWRAAADAWEHIGQPYERALALMEGGEDALREALAILHGLEAGPLAALVRQRLRERGARGVPRGPRRATLREPLEPDGKGAGGVTAAGPRLHERAARTVLHRSPKTVEHHVCAVLAKMGVHSRAEAVAVAHARGMISPRTP